MVLAVGTEASCLTGRKGSQLTFFNPFSSVWKTAIAAKNTVDDFNFKVVLAAHVASGVQPQDTRARHACLALSLANSMFVMWYKIIMIILSHMLCNFYFNLPDAGLLCRVLARSWEGSLSCKLVVVVLSISSQRKTSANLLATRR